MELNTAPFNGFDLQEPTGVLNGLKVKDLDATRALRIAALKDNLKKNVKSISIGGEEAISEERKKLLFRNPHTEEFCKEWKLLGYGEEEGKEVAFPLNPLEQPGIFEKIKPIYNELKANGFIPNARPDITFDDASQNKILEGVKKVWEKEQPELPFPTNFFLNFWQLMQYNTAFEQKSREEILEEMNSSVDPFATQNQKAEGEVGSYNADTPHDERPNKRRMLSKTINYDEPD